MLQIPSFTLRQCRGIAVLVNAPLDSFQEPYPRCPHESAPMGAGTIVGSGGKAELIELIKEVFSRIRASEASAASEQARSAGLVYCSTTYTRNYSRSTKSFWNRYLGLFQGSSARHRFAPEWYHCVGELVWL